VGKKKLREMLKKSKLMPQVLEIPEEHKETVKHLEEQLAIAELAVKTAHHANYRAHTLFWAHLRTIVFPESTLTSSTYAGGKVLLHTPSYQELERDVQLLKKLFINDDNYSMAAEMRDIQTVVREVRDMITPECEELSTAKSELGKMIVKFESKLCRGADE